MMTTSQMKTILLMKQGKNRRQPQKGSLSENEDNIIKNVING